MRVWGRLGGKSVEQVETLRGSQKKDLLQTEEQINLYVSTLLIKDFYLFFDNPLRDPIIREL